jgi:hypothetical protein
MSFEKIVAGLAVLALVLVSCAGAAWPQASQCAPYAAMATHLADRYGEAVIFQGQTSETAIMQLWANAETGTWTVVYMSADAPACMVASGQGGESIAPPPAGTEG